MTSMKFIKQLFNWAPLVGVISLVVWIVFSGAATAQTTPTLATKQYNSYGQDGTTTASDPVSAKYLMLLGGKGSDGAYHIIATDASGNIAAAGNSTPSDTTANPTTAALSESFNMGWDATNSVWKRLQVTAATGHLIVDAGTGFSAGGSSTPSDAFANPTTAFLNQTFNMIYNGTTWDMMRGDANKNLMVSLGTQLDGANDKVSIEVNHVTPGLLTAGADATSNTFNGIQANTFGYVWNATTWDRLAGFAGNADAVTSPTKGLAGAAAFLFAYNGTSMDRVRLDGSAGNLLTKARVTEGSVLTGYSQPGTNIEISGSAVKYCTASNALTVGAYYEVQTDGRTHCAMVADNTGAVATTDEPYDSPGIYHRYVQDTSHDTLCCITTAATVTVDITPQTLTAQ